MKHRLNGACASVFAALLLLASTTVLAGPAAVAIQTFRISVVKLDTPTLVPRFSPVQSAAVDAVCVDLQGNAALFDLSWHRLSSHSSPEDRPREYVALGAINDAMSLVLDRSSSVVDSQQPSWGRSQDTQSSTCPLRSQVPVFIPQIGQADSRQHRGPMLSGGLADPVAGSGKSDVWERTPTLMMLVRPE